MFIWKYCSLINTQKMHLCSYLNNTQLSLKLCAIASTLIWPQIYK